MAKRTAANEDRSREWSVRFPDLVAASEWAKTAKLLGLSTQQAAILRSAFYDERDFAIAKRVGRSIHTVHTQRIRLFRKLGVSSMAQAIAVVTSAFVVRDSISRGPTAARPGI